MPVPVVGTGPIAASWPTRARRLRSADVAWVANPAASPMPPGLDAAFFSEAPLDQRLDEPPSSKHRLVLEGLHPEHASLTTHLAPVAPVVLVEEGSVVAPELVADTLVVDADRGVATLTFRGVVRAPHRAFEAPIRFRVELADDPSADKPVTVVPPAPERRDALVDLIGFDAEVPGRLRRSRAHAQLVASVPAGSPPKLEVLRALTSATSSAKASLRDANANADELELPLVAVAGDLTVPFDDTEALKLAIALTSRIGTSDRTVRGALELAARVVESPMPLSSEGAAALLSQLYRATDKLPLPPGLIESQVARELREQRRYRKRHVLGALHVRAELAIEGGSVPLYLSEAIAQRLPLAPSCRVVALVEVRPGEDFAEVDDDVLVAMALGRVVRSADARGVAA
jgi:hypothetical protein